MQFLKSLFTSNASDESQRPPRRWDSLRDAIDNIFNHDWDYGYQGKRENDLFLAELREHGYKPYTEIEEDDLDGLSERDAAAYKLIGMAMNQFQAGAGLDGVVGSGLRRYVEEPSPAVQHPSM